MEDSAHAVVPLRPGFDIQVRGFHRRQVTEHIELLEDQLRMVSIDRNEAVALNSDLRRLCDDARHDLAEAELRLKRIEASDTGLPHASQRVQNMLSLAEEEVQTLREQAQRQAQTMRGSAEYEAQQLISAAERAAEDMRSECSRLVDELDARQRQIRREHEQSLAEIRERERVMRHNIRDEYKAVVTAAQEEADELLSRTRWECGQRDAETEQLRLDVLQDLHTKQARMEELRTAVLSSLDSVGRLVGATTNEIGAQEIDNVIDAELVGEPAQHVWLPEPRGDTQSYLIPLGSPLVPTGTDDAEPAADTDSEPTDAVQRN
ncbi:hypothetical protein OOZ19_25075 [Saccharopolyspora sp. NFXS83]|uniref:hypothetical protein n=1 Tax=Saccharopolyspora sp. NFXS83 TaxID=2993560 RepID=UPI00224AC065|nr:hypothetical protein [Saccharopolyspora sp. NFXS83]MCX2733528.1 hypothetical protein [Saccharopolyspora sp. NFXS83]